MTLKQTVVQALLLSVRSFDRYLLVRYLQLCCDVVRLRTAQQVREDSESVTTKQAQRQERRRLDPNAQIKLHKSHNGVRGTTVLNVAIDFQALSDALTDFMHLENNLLQEFADLFFSAEFKVRFLSFSQFAQSPLKQILVCVRTNDGL